MRWFSILKGAALASLIILVGSGCASRAKTPPPLKVARPATSPAEVLQALPGVWVIDVEASADALARMPYQPRQTTVLHRDEHAGDTHEPATVTDRFDMQAYREARRYWTDLLEQPDMRWRLTFRTNGTGEHLAVVKAGEAPKPTPFKWRMEGWRVYIDYPPDSQFHSFDVEMHTSTDLNYPMKPIGDHLVLHRLPTP
jgi:hypothetical protein